MAAAWLERGRAYAPLATRSAIVTLQLLTGFHLITTDLLEIRLCSGYSMLPTFSHTGDFVLISPLHVRFHQTSSARAAAGIPPPTVSHPDIGDGSTSSILSSLKPDFQIHIGDLVISTSPTDPRVTVCKRVLGLEGDVIELDPSKSSRALAESQRVAAEQGEKRWEEVDAEHRSMLAGQKRRARVRDRDRDEPDDPNDLIQSFHSASRTPASQSFHSTIFSPSDPRPRSRSRSSNIPEGTERLTIPRGHVWLAGDNTSNSTDSRAYGPVPIGLIKGKVVARVWPNPVWLSNPMKRLERDG